MSRGSKPATPSMPALALTPSFAQSVKGRALGGYSFDAESNLEILANEVFSISYCGENEFLLSTERVKSPRNATKSAAVEQAETSASDSAGSTRKISGTEARALVSIYRVWAWIERVEERVEVTEQSIRYRGACELFSAGPATSPTKPAAAAPAASSAVPPSIPPPKAEKKVHWRTGLSYFASADRGDIRRHCGWLQEIADYEESEDDDDDGSSSDDKSSDKDAKLDSVLRHSKDTDSSSDSSSASSLSFNERETSGKSRGRSSDSSDQSGDRGIKKTGSSGSGPIDSVMDSLSQSSIERAAVVALWHCDVDRCTSILLSIIKAREQAAAGSHGKVHGRAGIGMKVEIDKNVDEEYLHLLTLIAMCFAGFQTQELHEGQPPDEQSSWRTMCKRVISRLLLSARKAAAYLVAGCKFLMANEFSSSASKKLYQEILTIDTKSGIAVEDQVAFAATYLDDNDLQSWLARNLALVQEQGILEGLVLTGLSKNGFSLLQKYLEVTSDLQSVALIAARVLPQNSAEDKSRVSGKEKPEKKQDSVTYKAIHWLNEYRNMLNNWAMFVERAYLDREIGQKISLNKMKQEEETEEALVAADSKEAPLTLRRAKSGDRASQTLPASGLLAVQMLDSLPASAFSAMHLSCLRLKCKDCQNRLPSVDLHDLTAEVWKEMKSSTNPASNCGIGSCCEQLPSCYVCQRHMGGLNAYMEAESTQDDDIQQDSNEQFVIWVCQACRHGGHASCLKEWFGYQTKKAEMGMSVMMQVRKTDASGTIVPVPKVCGVNGCSCQCKVHVSYSSTSS